MVIYVVKKINNSPELITKVLPCYDNLFTVINLLLLSCRVLTKSESNRADKTLYSKLIYLIILSCCEHWKLLINILSKVVFSSSVNIVIKFHLFQAFSPVYPKGANISGGHCIFVLVESKRDLHNTARIFQWLSQIFHSNITSTCCSVILMPAASIYTDRQ